MPESQGDKLRVGTDGSRLPGPGESSSEQVRRWIETPVEFWEACARDYGPMVSLSLGSLGTVILISDPESVKAVFQLSPDAFECHQYNEHYRYVMGDNSVLLQDGERHRGQRRLLSPMLRHEPFVPKVPAIRAIALRTVSTWPVEEAFRPRPSFQEITFQVMVDLLLGNLESETGQALVSAYREAVLRQVGSWGPWRNFTRMQPKIRELLAAEIGVRRADPLQPGALTSLAQARDSDGLPISDAELEDHVFSLLVAGVDTTAISLTWALYWLCRKERVRETLLEEMTGAGSALPGPHLLDLPYLNAVFSEVLRMVPIVPTPSGRKLTRETRIGRYVFPAGTTLVPCTYLVHRREDLYPNGDRFLPERFLDRRFAPHEYFPFGGGARACLGGMLAEVEFKVVLAAVLSCWEIQALDTRPLQPIRHGTLLAPPDEFQVVVRSMAPAQRGTA
ncbi:MAG TPA: cytochrome P450 [Chthonomonadaceae bacterium]|nr:cytochrome P450 [Chthonomonadaceae bacterium]